jgi:hypothetical protein
MAAAMNGIAPRGSFIRRHVPACRLQPPAIRLAALMGSAIRG